jgi:archaellum component FlaG (FlaF/FlaG flagellin family)
MFHGASNLILPNKAGQPTRKTARLTAPLTFRANQTLHTLIHTFAILKQPQYQVVNQEQETATFD